MVLGEGKVLDHRLFLVKRVLMDLLTDNPYLSLYYSPYLNGPIYTGNMEYVNYLHQISFYTHALLMKKIRILLGDDVGIGKTVEAIRIIKYMLSRRRASKILIIVPAGLIDQWISQDLINLGITKIKVIDEDSIDRLIQSYKIHGDIEDGVYIGSMDKLKFSSKDQGRGRHKPYYDLVSNIKWDLVVIDEAHRLTGSISGRRSLRFRRLGTLCIEADNCLLLTATPSRGDPVDFINRLALLDPQIKSLEKRLRGRKQLLDTSTISIYKAIHGAILVRRTKDYVNKAEGTKIFTELFSLVAIAEIPLEEQVKYDELVRLLVFLLKKLGTGRETGLLRSLLIKRALSSPIGFINTLDRVVGKRISGWEKTGEIEDLLDIYELDIVEEKVLPMLNRRLDKESIKKILETVRILKSRFTGPRDVKADALYQLLSRRDLLGNDVTGFLVFSEYKDTINHLYYYVRRKLENDDHIRLDDELKKILRKAIGEYCASLSRRYRLCRNRNSTLRELTNYISLYEGSRDSYLIIRISSDNKYIVPIIPILIEAVWRTYSGRTRIVVLSTDVASEGLNLQQLNVVVNYDVPWSPIRREQRLGRIHRLRQTRNCLVIDLIRNTWLEYELYVNLLLKLYGMSLQSLGSRRISGFMIINPLKREPSLNNIVRYYSFNEIDDYTLLSEVSALIAKSSAEKETVDRERLRQLLRASVKKLVALVKQYNMLSKILERPVIKPQYIREQAKDLYGFTDHDEVHEKIRELYQVVVGSILGEEIHSVPRRLDEVLVRLWDKLRGLHLRRIRDGFIIYQEMGREWDKGVLLWARLIDKDHNIELYVFPVLVLLKGNGRSFEIGDVKLGMEVIDWLVSNIVFMEPISTKALIYEVPRLPGSFIDSLASRLLIHIMSRIKKWIHMEVKKIAEYRDLVGPESRILPPELKMKIDQNEYAVFYFKGMGEEEYPSPSEETRIKVEEYSLNLVIELLEKRGYEILDTHLGEPYPYDILARDPMGKTWYVEVKGHLPPIMWARLSPNESVYAEAHPDNYLVCLVTDIASGSPLVICRTYKELQREKLIHLAGEIVYF